MLFEERESPQIPGQLENAENTAALKERIGMMLRIHNFGRFPGTQPVSFERKHIKEKLMQEDYYVCEKSDGLRCLMLIAVNGNKEQGVFLIDRTYNFYYVNNLFFPASKDNLNEPLNDTLVDGELVLDKNMNGETELRYLVFDLLAVSGKSYLRRPTENRLNHIKDLIEPYYAFRTKHPEESANFSFKVTMKKMNKCTKIPGILDSLPTLPHFSDGLIFTPCNNPYITETDDSLLKWKPAEENSIDFRIRLIFKVFKDPDTLEEYLDYDSKPMIQLLEWTGSRNEEYFADLSLLDQDWEELKKLGQPLNRRIVEVKKTEVGDWKLLRFRDDKEYGNHKSVVEKVLKSIADGVLAEELKELTPQIEKNWIKRIENRKRRAIKRQRFKDSKVESAGSYFDMEQEDDFGIRYFVNSIEE